jgi:hypothetical protein
MAAGRLDREGIQPAPPRFGGLSQVKWMKILLHIADPESILSDRQTRTIVYWAANRSRFRTFSSSPLLSD